MVTLSSLIDTVKTTPVSIKFLKARVPKNVDVLVYQSLKGKHRTDVFRGKRAVVVLIPKIGEDIGHFIVLVKWPKSIEYFSSLGGSPTKELEKLHEPKAIFEALLGKQFNYNRRQLQSGAYNINDCAAWVLLRVYFRKYKLREFLELFQRRITLETPDDLAAIMAIALFQDR
mgnify:CR=1 FL=1